jgi:Fe-S-cluster containining protein
MNFDPPGPSSESAIGFMASATPQLRAAIAAHQKALTQGEFGEMIAKVRILFVRYTERLLGFPPGVERGAALHRMLDEEMKAAANIPISCTKGCSGCCHYEVEITQDEAALLKRAVLGGLSIDRERLAVQAGRERRSLEWKKLGDRTNRCVFLGDDEACSVYEDRPSICRKHLVTTPAIACTTRGMQVSPVQILLAEILLSASLSLPDTAVGSLATMLSQSLA